MGFKKYLTKKNLKKAGLAYVTGGGTLYAQYAKDIYKDVSGANAQAKAAERAAAAEAAMRGNVTAESRLAAERLNLAAQSPQQLMALEKSYKAAQTQVDTDLRQLAAIDPAIMEASKQVLTLLQGGKAAVNDPMMQQRAGQRQQLVDSLRAQYGPGAESSSIGQRALQQFDMQTNSSFQQNQQNSLGQLFGMATTRVQGHGFGQMMDVSQGYGNYQSRIANAEHMGSQGILNAMTGQVASAGAPFVGDFMRAGADRQLTNMAMQAGLAYATGGTSLAAAKPTADAASGLGAMNSSPVYSTSPMQAFGGNGASSGTWSQYPTSNIGY
jgi:hypothetical protein